MESNIPNYLSTSDIWRDFLLNNGKKYYKKLTFKDLKKKKMFKHTNIKPGSLYVVNTMATNTNKTKGSKADFDERITLLYVIDYKDRHDFEMISLNYVRLSSESLNKKNIKDIGFLRDILKKSGTDEFMHWIHTFLIVAEIINLKEEYINLNNKGKIERFYSKFWYDEWKDPAKIMGIKKEVKKTPLSTHLRPGKRDRTSIGISYLYGANNKYRLKAKGMRRHTSFKKGPYDFNNLYVGNTNMWKLLLRRPVIYDNRIINWTNTYKINN